jgi:hypothetical protein
MKQGFSLCLSAMMLITHASMIGQALRKQYPIPNASVNVIKTDGDTVFIGGEFTLLHHYTGNMVLLDTASGLRQTFPLIEGGAVRAAVSDGASGWFIGGDFTVVNQIVKPRLVHIFANGTLDENWHPNPNGSVSGLVLIGATLNVCGSFTYIGQETRSGLAAVSASSGRATAWNPGSGSVFVMELSGNDLYVGGGFTAIAGTTQRGVAKFNAATGALVNWNPRIPNGSVEAIKIFGNRVYLGGSFTSIGD